MAVSRNERLAFDRLRSKGYSAQAASGIVGNWQEESGTNPRSNQHGGGPGRGIEQWSVNERWAALQKWAKNRHLNPLALNTQVDYSIHEMDVAGFSKGFKKSTNVADATRRFEQVMERPGVPHTDVRLSNAAAVFASLGGRAYTPPAIHTGRPGGDLIGGMGPTVAPRSHHAGSHTHHAGIGDVIGGAAGAIGGAAGDAIGGAAGAAGDAAGSVIDSIDSIPKAIGALFSGSFWVRMSFIIIGVALLLIGVKALVSGSASGSSSGGPSPAIPQQRSAPSSGTKKSAEQSKPKTGVASGKGVEGDAGEVAEVA